MNDTEKKARALIKAAMKQPIAKSDDTDGVEVTLLCPTCYQTRKGRARKELADKVGDDKAIMHQCATCRAIGREINLDELKAVLEGKRIPLPNIDENYTLSDLIDDLLKKDDDPSDID